jgi:hypothetical protein
MNQEYQQYDCVYSYHQYEGLSDWLGKIIKLEEIDHKNLCTIQKIILSFHVPLNTFGLTYAPSLMNFSLLLEKMQYEKP